MRQPEYGANRSGWFNIKRIAFRDGFVVPDVVALRLSHGFSGLNSETIISIRFGRSFSITKRDEAAGSFEGRSRRRLIKS
jgi:hypothetical protein